MSSVLPEWSDRLLYSELSSGHAWWGGLDDRGNLEKDWKALARRKRNGIGSQSVRGSGRFRHLQRLSTDGWNAVLCDRRDLKSYLEATSAKIIESLVLC